MLTKERDYIEYFEKARRANRKPVATAVIDGTLRDIAIAAIANTDYILAENKKDLDQMDPGDPKYDRLKLTSERIKSCCCAHQSARQSTVKQYHA
jgi:glutamate-5-semialdehyde dehydrogenase